MKRIIALTLSALTLMGMLFMVDAKLSALNTRVATLSSVKGNVTVTLVSQAGQSKPATNNMVLNEGDSIKTAGGASAILKFDDGSMVKVGPLSVMKLGKLKRTDKGAMTQLNMNGGKTWNRVNKLGAGSTFTIKTPSAIAGVRGTYYSAEVENDSESKFAVFDGSVAVSNVASPGQETLVGKNQTTTVSGNKPPTPPTTIPKGILEQEREGFSEAEATASSFELRIEANPPSITPGGKSVVTIKVYRGGKPFAKEVPVRLKLSGSAVFVSSGTSEIEVTTGSDGSASAEITSSAEEAVSVDATLQVKVKKKKQD